MKTLTATSLTLIFLLIIYTVTAKIPAEKSSNADKVQQLKEQLKYLQGNAKDSLFAIHFQSMLNLIDARGKLTKVDSALLSETLPCFIDSNFPANASIESSYLNRQRPLIISYVSPTDGSTSFFRLRLPANLDVEKSYPLYIELHGFWDVAENPLDLMTYSFRNGPATSFAYEDGYYITPWGRGNNFYQGIGETDVWETIEKTESLVNIDLSRKYLIGHSMGGYGAWVIASKSTYTWAAVGIHAGALNWGSLDVLSDEIIDRMKNMPVYFVVGLKDNFYNFNLTAYMLLQSAGNQNVELVSFDGGHDYLPSNVETMYRWLRCFVNKDYLSYYKLKEKGKTALIIAPDPVKLQATIKINLKEPGFVLLNLYDLTGQLADTLVSGEMKAGETVIQWKKESLRGGTYTWSFICGKQKLKGKVLLN